MVFLYCHCLSFYLSFISVSNLSISFSFFLVIFLNFISSLILFRPSQDLSFIAKNIFFSNSSNPSIFFYFQFFSTFLVLFLKAIKLSSNFSISILISHWIDIFLYMCWTKSCKKFYDVFRSINCFTIIIFFKFFVSACITML